MGGWTIRFRLCVAAGALAWHLLAGVAIAQSLRAPVFERSPSIKYITAHIPKVTLPGYEGRRYEARVPDTLDLQQRAALAIHGLTNTTDPESDYEIYWAAQLNRNPIYMWHSWNDACGSKYVDSLPLLRLASGSRLNLAVERRWLELVLHMQGPDGLLYFPEAGKSWWPSQCYGPHPPGEHYTIVYADGRLLDAIAVYYRLTGDRLWKDVGKRVVDGLGTLSPVSAGEIPGQQGTHQEDHALCGQPANRLVKEEANMGRFRGRLAWAILGVVVLTFSVGQAQAEEARLFPADLPAHQWREFGADGFSGPVAGVVWRDGSMLPGMPLGGIGTGFVGLGTDGTLDYVNTIFNTFMVRGGNQDRAAVPSYRLPFLALAVGGKTTLLSLRRISGVQGVKNIDYWGHFPVADMHFQLDGPIQAAVRAWSPFVPGDFLSSNTSGAVFEVRLQNTSNRAQQGVLAFSFSGPVRFEKRPRFLKSGVNGRPGAVFEGDERNVTLPLHPTATAAVPNALAGDAAFTIFFVGTIRKTDGLWVHPVSWGTGLVRGQGSALEIDLKADRVDWATGWSSDAQTPDGCFKHCYGKPTVLCIRKRPGPIKSNAAIWINGAHQPLSSSSSGETPKIAASEIRLGFGAGFETPRMVVGETIVFRRALGDEEILSLHGYLSRKFGLKLEGMGRAEARSPHTVAGLHAWFDPASFKDIQDGEMLSSGAGADISKIARKELRGELRGVAVSGKRAAFANDAPGQYDFGYALGVLGEEETVCGGPLGENAAAWSQLAEALPSPSAQSAGTTVRVTFALSPGGHKTIRFVLAWYAPSWTSTSTSPWPTDGVGKRYTNAYAARFKDAAEVASFLACQHQLLLDRVLAWQGVVYGEKKLPLWLRDSLVNNLAILAQESFLLKAPHPGHWWGQEPFFCVNESLQSCPQQSCIANDEFGEWAVNLLFPKLGLRKLEAFKHYQRQQTGQTPSTLGPHIEPDRPWFDQQLVIDGQVYVHAVDRYRLSSGDDQILDAWYPSVKAGLKFMFTTDRNGDGLPDVRGTNHYLDAWPMEGAAPHVATYWLATLQIAKRMAQMQHDTDFAPECEAWCEKAARSLEKILWNEPVGSYLLYHDPASGKKSDTVVCDQLAGSFFASMHNLPPVLPHERVRRILATLERLNYAATPYGIRLSCRPDGSEDATAYYSPFIVPSYSTMYVVDAALRGGDRHFQQLGEEILRRTWHNMVMRQKMIWDQPCMLKVDGTRAWGLEYYHNTMLWTMPLSFLGQDIRTACSPGGFIYRVRTAGSTRAAVR